MTTTTGQDCSQISILNDNEIIYDGKIYQWSAVQNSEHPDFVLRFDGGEIWVQIVVGIDDRLHQRMYLDGKTKWPISDHTAHKIVSKIICKGYIKRYFETDVGLIFTEDGDLIEN